MNGMERIIAALSHKLPDRVPLYIHGVNEGPIIGLAQNLTDGLPQTHDIHAMTDAEKMKLVDALFLVHEHYQVDGFTAFEIGHETVIDDSNIIDDWGVVYERSEHGLPVAKLHPIPDRSGLIDYSPPRPKREHLLLLDLAADRFKGEKALFWMMRGSFVRSWRLTGMTNWMLKMFDDPDFIHDLAKMTLEYNLQTLDMAAQAGAHVLIVEDDIAGNKYPLISPAQFKEFILPYNRVLVDKAHAQGLKVIRHSDGALWPLLDMLLEAGYDGLNPLEPQAGMDLAKVKAYCGDKLCLLGNIDSVDLLPSGKPEEVDAAVKKAIEDAGAGGGLIICSSNSLHPGVKTENCIAMFEATLKYGKYEKESVTGD